MPTSATSPPPRAQYAAAGVASAVAGLGAGHLTAALVEPAASPVLAVGSAVIDAAPIWLKEFAVQTLGTADKPALVAGVALVTIAAAAGVGIMSRRSWRTAVAAYLALGAVAAIAAWRAAPSIPLAVLPSVVTLIVALALLSWLRGPRSEVRRPTSGASVGLPAAEATSADPTAPASPAAASRRRVLVGSAAVTALGTLAALAGQKLAAAPTRIAARVLPKPARAAAPLPTGLEATVPGISALQTPIAEFYRIDTALVIPRVDAAGWKLTIDGMVDTPLTISFDELLAMPMVEKDVTINCVSNEVGGPYIGSARWLGVPVKGLLERAGVQPGADQILSTSVDGMTISTPVQALLDDREAIIAVAMDGEPLPARHGYPARLITPGLYGFVGATKWLSRLTATTFAADPAYWTRRGWAAQAPVKTQTRIDTPRGSADAGTVAIGGVAWAQGRGIASVEVRVDGGQWQRARLGPDVGVDYWRQWWLPWDFTPGSHAITARATDGTGETQTADHTDVVPDGATGWHTVQVMVS